MGARHLLGRSRSASPAHFRKRRRRAVSARVLRVRDRFRVLAHALGAWDGVGRADRAWRVLVRSRWIRGGVRSGDDDAVATVRGGCGAVAALFLGGHDAHEHLRALGSRFSVRADLGHDAARFRWASAHLGNGGFSDGGDGRCRVGCDACNHARRSPCGRGYRNACGEHEQSLRAYGDGSGFGCTRDDPRCGVRCALDGGRGVLDGSDRSRLGVLDAPVRCAVMAWAG